MKSPKASGQQTCHHLVSLDLALAKDLALALLD